MRARAQELRREDNPAEAVLWAILRHRRLHGWKFRRQCALGPFIADFYCPEQRLIVEVDGLVHSESDVRVHDAARDARLQERGLRVVRIPAAAIFRNARTAIARIESAVAGVDKSVPSSTGLPNEHPPYSIDHANPSPDDVL